MLLLSDIHFGFRRVGGTTPDSQEALRTWLYSEVRRFLSEAEDDHLVILGDLFDDFDVSNRDLIDTFRIILTWIGQQGRKLTLVAGNHDHSPRAERMSSFQALSKVLQADGMQVVGIDQTSYIGDGVWAVAHCSSQDAFTKTLEMVLVEIDGHFSPHVLLHANYDNKFAAQTDHSLNVSEEMAKRFKDAGATLVFAHEHQKRQALGGAVQVLGNQWPTSISDCLGNDEKFAHRLVDRSLTKLCTWSSDAGRSYEQVPWDLLDDYPADNGAGFIRVFGTATASQASEVVDKIARFRQRSTAFVVTNAVTVGGIAEAEQLPDAFEAAKRFDVMDYLSQHLDAAEMKTVNELLEKA